MLCKKNNLKRIASPFKDDKNEKIFLDAEIQHILEEMEEKVKEFRELISLEPFNLSTIDFLLPIPDLLKKAEISNYKEINEKFVTPNAIKPVNNFCMNSNSTESSLKKKRAKKDFSKFERKGSKININVKRKLKEISKTKQFISKYEMLKRAST